VARPHPLLVSLAAARDPEPIVVPDEPMLASAVNHGMHGLLWSWVRDNDIGSAIRPRLAGVALAAQQRHQRFWDILTKVRGIAEDAGISVATVKGVTAEARWYPGLGQRPCSDVDLLVRPDALTRAGVLLDALDAQHPLRPEINALVASGAMQSVTVRVDGVSLDVHFDLFKLGTATRQRDLVWERMQAFRLDDGTTINVPDAELSLMHFLLHLNKDSFARLLGYADIARILQQEHLDWGFIDRFLRVEGLEVPAYCSLSTVVERLGLQRPHAAIVRGARVRLWRMVWPERVTLLGGAGVDRSRRQDLIPFVARGRFGEALGWARRVVLPPVPTVALRYADVPGPYLWRLTRGRVRTAQHRHRALRARRMPAIGISEATDVAPETTASVLRKAAAARPLWIDVRGTSMGRSILDGSRVRVEPAAHPRRAQVWAFCDVAGNIVVHRCRGECAGTFRFQGDARVHADAPIPKAQLIGRVVELDPPRAALRWGALAGGLQRTPRVAIAVVARRLRLRTANEQP
jgi:hypothetical protein